MSVPREIWAWKNNLLSWPEGSWKSVEVKTPSVSRYILADQWIPVSEGPPKKDDDYLVWLGDEDEGRRVFRYWHGSWETEFGVNADDIVTHYQPLPDPPKEEL